MGLGTSVLEADLAGRRALGFDIDFPSIKIALVKTNSLEKQAVKNTFG